MVRIEATSEPAPGSVIPSARDPLPADRRAQEALVLVGGAEPVDRRGGDPGMGAEPGADAARRAGGGQLLGPDGVVDVVAALAAELRRGT